VLPGRPGSAPPSAASTITAIVLAHLFMHTANRLSRSLDKSFGNSWAIS
jgi:hypothetical protein